MTAISLGHATRLSRPGSAAIIAANKVGQSSRGSSRLIRPAQPREHLELRFDNSQPQEFAAGFVDFLLGRGHPQSAMNRLTIED
jgi:hypothetical protein